MHCNFVAKSPQMIDVLSVVDKLATSNSMVFIRGEKGVGKKTIAKQIHLKSLPEGTEGKFVDINCSLCSTQLMKSVFSRQNTTENFNQKVTIFFDEIEHLSLDLQQNLLEKIQDFQLGYRIIVSSSVDLEYMVQNGTFLKELYYRLTVLPLNILPLRHRRDDIEPLAIAFCKKFGAENKKKFTGFSQNAMQMLYDYYWVGNVRELKNAVERACILGQPPLIKTKDLCFKIEDPNANYDIQNFESESDKTLKTALHRFKKEFVKQILDSVGWNQTEAAKIMGIQRTYLSKLMSDLDIRK